MCVLSVLAGSSGRANSLLWAKKSALVQPQPLVLLLCVWLSICASGAVLVREFGSLSWWHRLDNACAKRSPMRCRFEWGDLESRVKARRSDRSFRCAWVRWFCATTTNFACTFCAFMTWCLSCIFGTCSKSLGHRNGDIASPPPVGLNAQFAEEELAVHLPQEKERKAQMDALMNLGKILQSFMSSNSSVAAKPTQKKKKKRKPVVPTQGCLGWWTC